jgi:hypothetical protein
VGAFAFLLLILLVVSPRGSEAGFFHNITLWAERDISFGIVATGSSPGRVVLDAATGAVTVDGGISFLGGFTHYAKFSGVAMTWGRRCTVTLVLPPRVELWRGRHRLTLDRFTLYPASITLCNMRPFSFQVGARLNVPPGMPGGTYWGRITAMAVFTDC